MRLAHILDSKVVNIIEGSVAPDLPGIWQPILDTDNVTIGDDFIDGSFNNIERLSKVVREDRDDRLKRNVDCYNPIRWSQLTIEQQDELKNYRQALLDVPGQETFPENPTWPDLPSFIVSPIGK